MTVEIRATYTVRKEEYQHMSYSSYKTFEDGLFLSAQSEFRARQVLGRIPKNIFSF